MVVEIRIDSNLSNSDYHANKTHLSSSKFKLLLDDAQKFYNEEVLGNRPVEETKPYFLVGSYFHSLTLEPEKVQEEYAFFPGFRKQGKAYDEFLQQNPKKVILSAQQKNVGELLSRALRAHPASKQLLCGGQPELSIFCTLQEIDVKARTDYINTDKAYIVDLKSTSHPTDHPAFKESVKQYGYDLSAALYLEVVELAFGKPFDFYFAVASKHDLGAAYYKLSAKTRKEGTAKLHEAMDLYKKCLKTGIWTTKSAEDAVLEEILEV